MTKRIIWWALTVGFIWVVGLITHIVLLTFFSAATMPIADVFWYSLMAATIMAIYMGSAFLLVLPDIEVDSGLK